MISMNTPSQGWILIHACQIWFITLGTKRNYSIKNKKVLRKNLGPVRNEFGEYERPKKGDLERLNVHFS